MGYRDTAGKAMDATSFPVSILQKAPTGPTAYSPSHTPTSPSGGPDHCSSSRAQEPTTEALLDKGVSKGAAPAKSRSARSYQPITQTRKATGKFRHARPGAGSRRSPSTSMGLSLAPRCAPQRISVWVGVGVEGGACRGDAQAGDGLEA